MNMISNETNYIRHKIQIDNSLNFSFFIMLPMRLNRQDLITLTSFVNKNDITKEQFEYLCDMSCEVDFLSVEKDENGFFINTFVSFQ